MNKFYTSRSAIETYQDCPRKRWLGYLYKGRGLAPKKCYIPYTTGSCVHKGVEFLLRNYQNGIITEAVGKGAERWVDDAVSISLQEYTKLVGDSGIQVKQGESEAFVFAQEQAKTEALVRAWSLTEFPNITRDYTIYSVEDDIVCTLSRGILFQAKVDAILQDKKLGSFYNYSLKTMASYKGEETDRTFKYGLQTITELWAAEQHMKGINELLKEFDKLAVHKISRHDKYESLKQYVTKYVGKVTNESPRISGTKFCFLIKGGKAKEVPDLGDEEDYIANSPLVKGYKYDDGHRRVFSHSFKYPNPQNKSGFSMLGKGWEAFNVWQEMTVKEWFEIITSKVQDHTGETVFEVQPECGDIIKKQIVTPPEVFVNRNEIDSSLEQIILQEQEVHDKFYHCGADTNSNTIGGSIDAHFPQNRKSCWYPTPCEFTPICHLKDWKGDSVDDNVREYPVNSGLYVYRIPHHKAELEALMVDQRVQE